MKKVFLIAFLLFTFSASYSQNSGIDIKYIHTPEGKEWKAMERPDGPQASAALMSGVFKFYSDGRISFNEKSSSNSNARVMPGEQKRWTYDKNTNIISWEVKSTSGEPTKCRAEITYVDEERMVTNLSENGGENIIFILIKQ